MDELTVEEIFEGKVKIMLNTQDDYPGLNTLLERLMKISIKKILKEETELKTKIRVQARKSFEYMTKISKGEIPTNSAIIREFVTSHPTYQKDSILSEVNQTT